MSKKHDGTTRFDEVFLLTFRVIPLKAPTKGQVRFHRETISGTFRITDDKELLQRAVLPSFIAKFILIRQGEFSD